MRKENMTEGKTAKAQPARSLKASNTRLKARVASLKRELEQTRLERDLAVLRATAAETLETTSNPVDFSPVTLWRCPKCPVIIPSKNAADRIEKHWRHHD